MEYDHLDLLRTYFHALEIQIRHLHQRSRGSGWRSCCRYLLCCFPHQNAKSQRRTHLYEFRFCYISCSDIFVGPEPRIEHYWHSELGHRSKSYLFLTVFCLHFICSDDNVPKLALPYPGSYNSHMFCAHPRWYPFHVTFSPAFFLDSASPQNNVNLCLHGRDKCPLPSDAPLDVESTNWRCDSLAEKRAERAVEQNYVGQKRLTINW